ncbi:23S rRNA (guanine-N-2-)-methyltransferase rlmG [Pseudoalteromonas luteoviolacea B = ATCC 29581]|nr:23S rRNA (guanine-N-2-)-methyltransferase rlmG [Pseudoalteromonas luteoviolacea B = ATCC 29581]
MQTEARLGEKQYTLHRFPLDQKNRSLQAWDSADELILEHITTLKTSPLHVLVINDAFGALACAIESPKLTWCSDSYISTQATKHNLNENALSQKTIEFQSSLATLPKSIDLVVIKLPKNNGYLAAILQQLARELEDNTPVLIAAKARDIHSSTLKLIGKYLHEPTTSLAVKKSRLVFASTTQSKINETNTIVTWPLENTPFVIHNHANVFSRDSLDIGARFFMNYLPQGKKPLHVVDLGCGNGVIGLSVLQKMPNAKVTFIDESHMAVASAQLNVEENLLPRVSDCQFIQGDCLSDFQSNSVDLVLCNPPFHQAQAITDHIAWQMFVEAKKALKVGGELRIIGNRHLGYDEKLKRLFDNCKLLGSNKKFVVLSAQKRGF